MVKRLFISALLIGILGFILLLSGIRFVSAQVEAGDCTEYCSDPYNPGPPAAGTYIEKSGTYCICPPTGSTNLEDLLTKVTNYIFWIATTITPILIIIGGFYFMTSGGEYEKITKAKHIITYTVIGYTIILFSRGLVYILADILGQ